MVYTPFIFFILPYYNLFYVLQISLDRVRLKSVDLARRGFLWNCIISPKRLGMPSPLASFLPPLLSRLLCSGIKTNIQGSTQKDNLLIWCISCGERIFVIRSSYSTSPSLLVGMFRNQFRCQGRRWEEVRYSLPPSSSSASFC